MNLLEGLVSEIERVTKIRAHYEAMRGTPQVMVEPAIMMMTMEIDRAKAALGSGDIGEMMAAYQALKENEE